MMSIDEVHQFWESNPLWTGECAHEPGSAAFFEEHRSVVIEDGFSGVFDIRVLPAPRRHGQEMKILDLGCGIGFWVSEFAMRGFNHLFAADLTQQALALTRKRLNHVGGGADLSQQNAEAMTFPSSTFDHVNCQGVIHHTPDTSSAIAEIARVLKPGGTASISVYYRNWLLRIWPYFYPFGWLLTKLGAGLKGRGRENIYVERNAAEIVRLYDGIANPIGKSYTRTEFVNLLESHFVVQETYLHFFPARSLPFKIPLSLHRWLDKNFGFLIYATLQKPYSE